MAKGKNLFYSVGGKYPLSVTRYSDAELFCEDAQDTVWCREDFFNEFVSPLLKFGEVYILKDSAAPEKKSKILIVRAPEHVRMFDSVGITQTQFPSYTPGPVEELLTTKPDNFKNKVKLFITGAADSEIFDNVPHFSKLIYREPLGESILVFDYEDNKDIIYDMFSYDEDDMNTIECALEDKDLECELENVDYYIDETFLEGYRILPNFVFIGTQAKVLANKIYLDVNPDFSFDDEEESKKVNKILYNIAPEGIENFFNAWVYYYDRSSFEAIARGIKKELAQIKEDTGFVLDPVNFTVSTTLGNLYYYLFFKNLTHLPIETALLKLSDNYKSVKNFGGWYDAKNELATDEFIDYNGLEQRTLPILKDIENKIKVVGNIDIIRDIFLKYDLRIRFSRSNKHPKTGKPFYFRDLDAKKGIVKLSDMSSIYSKTWEMTLEEFKDWLESDDAVLESKNILLSLQQILKDDSRKNRLT
jgi:hypothetical protein